MQKGRVMANTHRRLLRLASAAALFHCDWGTVLWRCILNSAANTRPGQQRMGLSRSSFTVPVAQEADQVLNRHWCCDSICP